MTEFLQAIMSFPTLIFTFFLCVCLVLGLMTIFGVLGFEAGDIDVDMDADMDADMDTGSAAEAVGLLSRFGLSGVPITLVISFLSLFGWFISLMFQIVLLNHITIPFLNYLFGFVTFLVSLAVSIWLTAMACKPLRKTFKSQDGIRNRHLIGQIATVRSGSVSMSYGEAVLDYEGAGLLLRIRAEEIQGFKKGDKVVLLEYLEDVQAYKVISEDEFRGI